MANWQVISLDTTTPQLRAPGTGDGYSFNSGSTQLGVWTTTGLGIGTASPAKMLDLASNNTGITTGDPGNILRFTDTDTTSAADQPFGRIEWYSADTDAAGVKAYIQGQSQDGSPDGNLVFATHYLSGGGLAERMRIDYAGNVGIGTTSPVVKFQIGTAGSVGAGAASNQLFGDYSLSAQLRVMFNNASNYVGLGTDASNNLIFGTSTANAGTSPTALVTLTQSGNLIIGTTAAAGSSQVTAYGATNGQIAVQNSTNWSRLLQNSNDLYIDNGVAGSAGNIIFRNSSSTVERARIDSSGNLLVGGTSTLPALPGGITANCQLGVQSASGGYIGVFRNDTSVFSGNTIGGLIAYGNDTTTNTVTPLTYILSVASGDHAAGDNPTDITFGTTPDNSETVAERARITNAGNVVVNTAAVATTATDGFLYIPTCAGAPTGVPTTFTGRSPLVVDSTNNRFYVYVNGAWKYATLT